MNWQEFIKDFIPDNEIVTVKATSLKQWLVDFEKQTEIIDKKDAELSALRRKVSALEAKIQLLETERPRYIDLEA